jgi:hypothetical protein
MRMEEPATVLSEVARELVCSEFSQNRRRIRRTVVVVVIRAHRVWRAGGGNSINIRFVVVLQILAVIQLNRHGQLSGEGEGWNKYAYSVGLMEMTVRWQDKNWTPLQLLSFIPTVTQRNRVEVGHEVKTSGPVEYSVGRGNVHEMLLMAK